jgi:excisionase family DNA binding protein
VSKASPAPLRLLSLEKVAETLDVSISTVRRLIKAGQLKATRVGGQLRVSAVALQNFITTNAVSPPHCPDLGTLDVS